MLENRHKLGKQGHTVVLMTEALWHGLKPARASSADFRDLESLEGHTGTCKHRHSCQPTRGIVDSPGFLIPLPGSPGAGR